MQIARVVGTVVSTQKNRKLEGAKLLLVQPIGADGRDSGRALVALDAVGAGAGERVFFVKGKEASFPFHPAQPPADACVVGIVDEVDVP